MRSGAKRGGGRGPGETLRRAKREKGEGRVRGATEMRGGWPGGRMMWGGGVGRNEAEGKGYASQG